MQRGDPIVIDNLDFLCPDRTSNTGQVILQAKVGNRRYQFDALEGYALERIYDRSIPMVTSSAKPTHKGLNESI